MSSYRSDELLALSAIPIILLFKGQNKITEISFVPWLLIVFVISLLVSGANLVWTQNRLTRLGLRIKDIAGSSNDQNKSDADYIPLSRFREAEQSINDLRKAIKNTNNELRALKLEISSLSQKVHVRFTQPQPPIASQTPSPLLSQPFKTESDVPILDSTPCQANILSQQDVPSGIHHELPVSLESEQTLDNLGKNRSDNTKLENFAVAIETSNGTAIREQKDSELNITKESEDALVRREAGHKTQLEDVNGGASYYRLSEGDRHWLFPTPLTLKTIAKYQPSKGLFQYDIQPDQAPRIRQPAEIRLISNNRWEVVELGIITVSG